MMNAIDEIYICTACLEPCKTHPVRKDKISDDYGYETDTIESNCCHAEVRERDENDE